MYISKYLDIGKLILILTQTQERRHGNLQEFNFLAKVYKRI